MFHPETRLEREERGRTVGGNGHGKQLEDDDGENWINGISYMRRPPPTRSTWCGYTKAHSLEKEMEDNVDSLLYRNSSLDVVQDFQEPEISESPDTRPSILITFQNSASYYTSYMGAGGTRGSGPRRKASDSVEPQQHKDHPIVVMNDYPTPAPVCVTVNSRKLSCDRSYSPYSGPPLPQGPPGPPGPPLPNLPPSRRESFMTNSLELPQKRRGSSVSPTTSRSHSPAGRTQTLAPKSLTLARPHTRLDNYESSSLPRSNKTRPPRNSHSMPAIADADALDFPCSLVPPASPRPSVCSSAMTESQAERRPLVYEHRSPEETEENNVTPYPKPNWLSLSLGEEDRKTNQVQSVYVAEVWPSLVCILTAVLMTLIVYILVSYFYSVPHPPTRNRIAPSPPRPTGYPPYPTHYPYPYPYIPPPYDRYPHYPQQPPLTDP